MKKILLLAAFASIAALGAQAQQTRPMQRTDKQEMRQKMTPDQRADRQAEMMQKRLHLTDDQTAKIREINLQTMPDKAMQNERREMRQERMAMMKKREEAYQQVLTKDQIAEFRKLKQQRMDKMKDMRAERKQSRQDAMQPASR